MAYNYAKEKRKFDAEWKRKASWYRKEGMSEDDIEEMRRFDLEQERTRAAGVRWRRPAALAMFRHLNRPQSAIAGSMR